MHTYLYMYVKTVYSMLHGLQVVVEIYSFKLQTSKSDNSITQTSNPMQIPKPLVKGWPVKSEMLGATSVEIRVTYFA